MWPIEPDGLYATLTGLTSRFADLPPIYVTENGCAYPDRHYVIRPNGAVAPCIYWEGPPIGVYPAEGLASISRGAPLARIREGLRSGEPVGTCATCSERRTALYRLRGTVASPSPVRLPTHPK